MSKAFCGYIITFIFSELRQPIHKQQDMLKSLRKKGVAKKIIWVIAVVIIISFGFLGTAYLLTDSGSAGYAGKMFGNKVSLEDFEAAHLAVRLQAIRQYGANLEKIVHLLNLDAQTWDRLILLREIKKKRIRVSNKEVVNAIEADESFQKNKQFDSLIYNAILRNLRIRPRDYEESARDNLKISKLFEQVTSAVTVSDDEIFDAYKERNEKVQVSYIFVANDSFKDEVVPQESDIKGYYEKHKSDFLTPPSVNVQYLNFPFPETEQPAGEQEIAPDTPNLQDEQIEEEKDKFRDKADEAFQALLVNPHIDEIASQFGMTAQTTGFFSKEQPNLALGWPFDLLNRIFEMGLSEVNRPFETSTGMVIVQVKETKEPYVPDYEEAKERARTAVIELKAKAIAKEKAGSYKQAVLGELEKSKLKDFPKAAKDLGLDIVQTPVFNRGQYLPQIGLSKDFQEAAFALNEENNISDVVETEKGYCILHLDSYIPVEESDYEKVKEELAQSISDQKRNEVFGEFLMQLRQTAGLIDNIPELRNQSQ